MVLLVPCRSITTCASLLNYIHSCPSDLQWHWAWISAVMFHSSRWHDIKTTVAVLCLPSSVSTASSSAYCRQASTGDTRTSRQPCHFQVTKVMRQVIRCKRQHSKGAMSFGGHKILKPGNRMHYFFLKKLIFFTCCMECRCGLAIRIRSVHLTNACIVKNGKKRTV